MHDQMLAAQICALRVTVSQGLDERRLLEFLVGQGSLWSHGCW